MRRGAQKKRENDKVGEHPQGRDQRLDALNGLGQRHVADHREKRVQRARGKARAVAADDDGAERAKQQADKREPACI